jgi:hypothetical protein
VGSGANCAHGNVWRKALRIALKPSLLVLLHVLQNALGEVLLQKFFNCAGLSYELINSALTTVPLMENKREIFTLARRVANVIILTPTGKSILITSNLGGSLDTGKEPYRLYTVTRIDFMAVM